MFVMKMNLMNLPIISELGKTLWINEREERDGFLTQNVNVYTFYTYH